jgi:hypothetical protein
VTFFIGNVRSGAFERPTWFQVVVPDADLYIWAAADNLKSTASGTPLRRPAAWSDTPQLAKTLAKALGGDMEVITASERLAAAIYKAARTKTVFHSLVHDVKVDSPKMATEEFIGLYNQDVDAQLVGTQPGMLVAGHDKYWILHRRLDKKANDAALDELNARATAAGKDPPAKKPYPDPPSVNYGGWTSEKKPPQQEAGGRHNDGHVDYSQVFRPIQRWAMKSDGARVDLLTWIEQNEGVPTRFTDLFRP